MRKFVIACLCLSLIGLFCNGTVIIANDWRMPIDCGDAYPGPLPPVGLFKIVGSCPVTDETRFRELADIYPLVIGDDYHYFSIGDVFMMLALIGAGTIVFIRLTLKWVIIPERQKRL